MAGVCARVGFLGGQNGLLRGEKIWHNGSGKNGQSARAAPGAEASV